MSTQPKVYVVQEPFQRFDRMTREKRPSQDLTPAHKFGQLVYLTAPRARPSDDGLVAAIAKKLEQFDSARDFLLVTGNMVLVGIATALASEFADSALQFLQWDRDADDYAVVKVAL